MRRILDEDRSPVSVQISNVTTTISNTILQNAGVTSAINMTLPVPAPSFLGSFSPFNWGGGEDANTADACNRLTAYLREAGVVVGVGGYKVVDVHRKNLLTIQLGRYSLKGKTDELIVPFKQSDDVRVLSQGRISLTSK